MNDFFYHFSMSKMDATGNADLEIPKTLTLCSANVHGIPEGQLFLDHVPVPRSNWRYDEHDKILLWSGAFGSGQLHLRHDGAGGVGVVARDMAMVSVQASVTAQFLCDVALDAGVVFTTDGSAISGMAWDPTCTQWQQACWVKGRLLLKYTEAPGRPMQPPVFTFEFDDNETGSLPWTPAVGAFSASLGLTNEWNLTFKTVTSPPSDTGMPATGPTSVYPYWLMATEDLAAATITGAIDITSSGQASDTLVGIAGARANQLITGYFLRDDAAVPFGVFDGKMVVGDLVLRAARVGANELRWSGLAPEVQAATGLPAAGVLRFSDAGLPLETADGVPCERLDTNTALAALTRSPRYCPATLQSLKDTPPALTISGLLAMNCYVQNAAGNWYDQVQQAVTADLQTIMNSFVSPDIYNLLFPNSTQPTLEGELAIIANSPVPGVANPSAWYQSLATAVMTQGLAGGNDSNCQYLNGPRAATWLKEQVAASKVYYTHGQLLFQYHWQQLFPSINDYLGDQQSNSATYTPIINQVAAAAIADINANVVPDPTNPQLIQNLIDDVTDAQTYATTNNLYWAFYYYTYNTAPSILANIALQMSPGSGNGDATALPRLFQLNAAVLTALDPSGVFAKRYTQTLNVFLATNVLPSMFGFNADPNTFSIIKEYLQTFVNQNIANEDAQIQAAAAELQTLINDSDFDSILKHSLDIINDLASAFQDVMSLPSIANGFLPKFIAAYPQFSKVASVFGSLLFTGLAGLSAYQMIMAFKSWDKMSDAEKAELITNAVQLGLQIVGAIVKRGVRIYAIFGAEGLSVGQRAGAIANILNSGEADVLDTALARIGNSAARWLGDTKGSIGLTQDPAITEMMMIGDADADVAAEVSVAARILGRNLDEFIAARLGPILILAGISFSIYNLVEGESTISKAMDGLNIAAGCLTLIAMAGAFAVEGGVIAGICSVAGPLAIVAAVAGIALALYEMFQKPPDPVQEFVNDYAQPAGLTVAARASSIDYVIPYTVDGLTLLGFTLSLNGSFYGCNADGTIASGTSSTLPGWVFFTQTDSQGLSGIFAKVSYSGSNSVVPLCLTLLSDDTVVFMPGTPTGTATVAGGSVTVTTQKWLSSPVGNAALAPDGQNLATLQLMLQPVVPDSAGNYSAAGATGWLAASGSSLGYSTAAGAQFTLTMSGIAPSSSYIIMKDICLPVNDKPSQNEAFSPSFSVMPSPKLTFVLTGTLPPFLNFDSDTCTFSPNGTVATAFNAAFSLAVSNALGNATTSFQIVVAAAKELS
ncbi:hypothetical protein NHH88_01670 [Oxalobacteraceae bacterium OTU3CAMAD1]|nr:hypothetical protein NHH88_01670 [Oxalobacteraceae bacterium OTU3CAMAD1]